MKEIHIKYERLFDLSKEIDGLNKEYKSTSADNSKNVGEFASRVQSFNQIMDISGSGYGELEAYSLSIPNSLNEVISMTSKLFNTIAQDEKNQDQEIKY